MKHLIFLVLLLLVVEVQAQQGLEVSILHKKVYPGISMGWDFTLKNKAFVRPQLGLSFAYVKSGIQFGNKFLLSSIYHRYHWYEDKVVFDYREVTIKRKFHSLGILTGGRVVLADHVELNLKLGPEIIFRNSQKAWFVGEFQILYLIGKSK